MLFDEELEAEEDSEAEEGPEPEKEPESDAERESEKELEAAHEPEAEAKPEVKDEPRAEKVPGAKDELGKAEGEREHKKDSSAKLDALKEKASTVGKWVIGALLVFVVAYSLFNGIPLLNGVELKDLPADMVDWVAWEVEEITGSVPHKEGPIYRVSKETEYDHAGRIISEHSYDYDRRGNMTRQAHMVYYSDSTDSSGDVYEYSDFDELGCFHTYNSKGGSPIDVTYEISDDLVKRREYGSNNYFEYEYYLGGKLKTLTHRHPEAIGKYEYDGNGLLHSSSFGSSEATASTKYYVWELDDEGHPKGYKFGHGTEAEVANLGDSAVHQIVCDDNGNIITVRDSQGKRELERQYVKIPRPSVFAWMKAHAIDLDYANEA